MLLYVGAFTGPGRGDGIATLRMDSHTGALSHVQYLHCISDPVFLARSPVGPYLYAVSQTRTTDGHATGRVIVFAIDREGGQLAKLAARSCHGTEPSHLSVHPSGRFLFVANFGSGSVAMFVI